jgi:SAM-dependent methyltransferase
MRPPGTILDIGCGIGLFLEEARRRGWEAQGVEVSSEAAGYAKEKLNLEVLVGRAEEVTFPRESVDVATLWHLLEHLEKPLTVLQGLQEALRPGGLLVVETPNARDPRGGRRLWRGDGHPRFHRFMFTPRALRWALVQAGFSRIEFVHWGYRLPEGSLSERLFGPARRLLKRALSWAGRDSVVTCLAWRGRSSSLSS